MAGRYRQFGIEAALETVRQAAASSAPRRSWRYIAGLTAIAVAYFVMAKLGLELASINPIATPIWPPTGLALAAVILWGYRVCPAVFLAALLANATTAGSIYTAAVIALGNTLECLVGGYFVNRWSSGSATFDTPAGVARFAAISLLVATPISATVGVGTLVTAGYADAARFLSVWITWWLGDLAGALVIAPVIVLWCRSGGRAINRKEVEGAVWVAAVAGVVGLIAFGPLIESSTIRDSLGFLSVVPLLWAALRGGRRDTATVTLILAGFAVWGTMSQVGPFARATQNDSFLLLLMFLMSTSVPSLILSADVAVRKQAEERQRQLTAELDHRVKNTLATVQALASLTLRSSESPAAFRKTFEARLHAMAKGHDLLGRGGWERADLGEIVRETLAPYADVDGKRVQVSGPAMMLTPSAATTLMMVLHELATNAAKHGALSTASGRVALDWRPDGGTVELRWVENAGPPVQVPTHRGFGSTFIEQGVVSSLGGNVQLDFAPSGLVCTIRVPLSEKVVRG
jgi:two-component sensor histidine kinase